MLPLLPTIIILLLTTLASTSTTPHLTHLPDPSVPGETAGTAKLQDGGYFTLYAEYAPGTWDQFLSPIKEYWLKKGFVHCDFHSAWPPNEGNLVYRTTTSGERNEGPAEMKCCARYYSCQIPPRLPAVE